MEIANFFDKGWQNDVTPSRQPQGTVRDLLNMRLISDDFNSYSLESVKGTLLSFSLNPGYFPIGWTRKGDSVVIFSTKDINGTNKNGEIGVATINPNTFIGTYVPYYNHLDLDFNSAHQIECQSYRENRYIERVYWTDNYNTFRAINLNDARFTTYFATGSLVVGDQYMVVAGTATHNAVAYGPNAAAGTVFTAVNANYTGTATVITYVDVTLLDVVPGYDQGNIYFNTWLPGGNLLGGGWQYTYRLFTTDGTRTNFSYVSMPFHVGNTVVPAISTLSYQAYQGGSITDNSQKGHRIQIEGIDVNFDRIQVVAMQDISLIGAAPPKIFYDGVITAATMTFDHMGNENLGTLTAADILEINLSIRKVRTLAILKKRMFIGGIEFSPFIEFDNTGVTAETFEYLMPSDTVGRPDDGSPASAAGLSGHGITLASVTAGVDALYKNQWYRVGGTGTITLNPGATVVAAGGTFQGTSAATTFTITTGAPTVTAVIRIQKYTGVYKYIDILDDWLDTKGAAAASHLKSHWRGETERWAIVFTDHFQNPQYAQWLMDKRIPEQYATTDPDTGGALGYNPRLAEETNNYYGAGLHDLSLRSIGLRFSGLDFNAVAANLGVPLSDLPTYIGGFYIVKAPLDRQILAQGILGPTVVDGNNTRPPSTLDVTNDLYATRRVQTYTFHSPEFLFAYDGLPNTLDGDTLKIVDYYDDAHQATPGAGTLDTNGAHVYSKMYRSTGAGVFGAKGAVNDVVTDATINIGVGQSGIQYDPVNNPALLFENRSSTSAAAPGMGGVARPCVGSQAYLISTAFNEPGTYPNGYVADDETRALVNYIRPKGNLYGGTGESALAATQYAYAGHYQPFDAAFHAYITGNGGIADDIEVFGGDAFVCVFDIGRMIQNFADAPNQSSFGMFFPVESRINVSLRQGRHLSKDRSYETVGNTAGLSFASPQNVENFNYNFGYSYEESQFLFPAKPVNFVPNSEFDRRVYVSPPKIDGEIVDNFRIFPVNAFIDLEGQNGSLTNLRSKSGRLFYWQRRSFGNLPVNEREAQATVFGQPLGIGVGGVLERYDDLENFYGNQNQFGLLETENMFSWFDLKRKTMCVASIGGQVVDLSTAKGLRTYFDDFTEDLLKLDNPVRNCGIAAAYNARFKEMLFSFRGIGDLHGRVFEPAGNSVGYDAINKQYTGKFSMLPGIMLEHNNLLLLSYVGQCPVIAALHAYALGDRVNEGNVTYACFLAYTSAAIPVQPSVDTTHWAKTTDINEIHVADEGVIAKFFGYVDDTKVQVVLEGAGRDTVFDNVNMESDQVFFDRARYQTSYQNGIDLDIINDTDNYQYLNRTWFWSVGVDISTLDRMRDRFCTMTLTKDNRVGGNPTVSKNERLKIISMRHKFRKLK